VSLCRAQQEQEVEVLAEAPDAADEVWQLDHLQTVTSKPNPAQRLRSLGCCPSLPLGGH
jgi:hypothetical protein